MHLPNRTRLFDIRIRRARGLVAAAVFTASMTGMPAGPPLGAQTVVAHRGASAYLPEHTFAAWDRALELGADYIEQDLQMTADGVLVVLHDATLDRTARGPWTTCTGAVAERTLAQLRECEVSSWKVEQLRAAGLHDAADALAALPPQGIPTLEDVFDRYGVDGRVRYYIETKNPEESPGMETELLRLLRVHGLFPASRDERTVLVQSFSEASLRSLARAEPGLPLVQLGDAGLRTDPGPSPDLGVEAGLRAGTVRKTMARIAEYAIGWGPSHRLVTRERVGAAHGLGLVVHPYTVNDPDRMLELLDLGVDGMFTDVPGVLLEVLGR